MLKSMCPNPSYISKRLWCLFKDFAICCLRNMPIKKMSLNRIIVCLAASSECVKNGPVLQMAGVSSPSLPQRCVLSQMVAPPLTSSLSSSMKAAEPAVYLGGLYSRVGMIA